MSKVAQKGKGEVSRAGFTRVESGRARRSKMKKAAKKATSTTSTTSTSGSSMTVRKLIEILQRCDGSLPVATSANNHEYMSGIDSAGACRVVLLHTYGGDHVCIGNVGRKNLNARNWYVKQELDGGKPIPKDYPRYVEGHWDFTEDFSDIGDDDWGTNQRRKGK